MDKEKKLRLEKALLDSRAKGNQRLTEALVEALEDAQSNSSNLKAA